MQPRNDYTQLKSALASYQFSLPESVIDDFAKIASILMNRDIILTQLSKLEERLLKDCALKGMLTKAETIRTLLDPNVHTQYKLLSDALYTWAADNNINTTFYKINAFLAPMTFHSILKQGIFFKDVGVPAEHGAWTHFLQWFIIFEADKEHSFLQNTPYDLYKITGYDESINIDGDKKFSIWFLCFDNIAGNNSDDCRSPDNLLGLIKRNPDNNLNLLSLILKKGFRNSLTLDNTHPTISIRDLSDGNKTLILRRHSNAS